MGLAQQIRPALPATISGSGVRLPETYENAKSALANCAQLDECQSWADKAAALASYAKQANDEELMKMATRIRDRAIRRAGELLKQIEPARGANQNITADTDPKVLSRKDAGAAAGMSDRQIKTAIRVANVPAEDFDKQVESANPPTVTKLARQGVQQRPALDPQTWLKGRDPAAFNKALHFTAEIEAYAKSLSSADLETILPNLDEQQAARVRQAIAEIDPIHDRIVTRI